MGRDVRSERAGVAPHLVELFSGPSRTPRAIGLDRSAGPAVTMPLGLILEWLERGQALGRDDVSV